MADQARGCRGTATDWLVQRAHRRRRHSVRRIASHPVSRPGPARLPVALDDETGELQWRVELPSLAGGDPAHADSTILVGDESGTLHVVSTAGERRWTRDLGAAVRTPTVVDGHVYVLDASATVHGFTLDGERCWEREQSGFLDELLGGPSFAADSAPAADDSRVYVTVQKNPDGGRTGR